MNTECKINKYLSEDRVNESKAKVIFNHKDFKIVDDEPGSTFAESYSLFYKGKLVKKYDNLNQLFHIK